MNCYIYIYIYVNLGKRKKWMKHNIDFDVRKKKEILWVKNYKYLKVLNMYIESI